MKTKMFTHYTQPYGWVKFKAELADAEVPKYDSSGRPSGTRRARVARGTVTESSWCGALLCGVPVSKASSDRFPVGSSYEVEIHHDWEWEQGEKISVAM